MGFDRAKAVEQMTLRHERDPATFNSYWLNITSENKKTGRATP